MKSVKIKLLLFLLMMGIVNGFAYDIEVDGFYYKIDIPSLSASLVKGDTDYHGDISIPEKFTYGNRVFTVISIDGAFKNDTELTSVYIPKTIKSINIESFKDASNLQSVKGLESITVISNDTFNGCVSLNNIEIPSQLLSIGKNAFSKTAISEFILPEKITDIPYGCFQDCKLLTNFEFNQSVTSIGQNAFNGCVSLVDFIFPETLTNIDDYAFQNCIGLTKLILPGKLGKMGKLAFSGCYNIQYLEIKYNSEPLEINNYAFDGTFFGCRFKHLYLDRNIKTPVTGYTYIGKSIEILEFGDNIKEIGYSYLFEDQPITYIRIPANMNSIGWRNFFNCNKLETIIFEKKNYDTYDYMFYQCPIKYFYMGGETTAYNTTLSDVDIVPYQNIVKGGNVTISGHGFNSTHIYNNELQYIGQNDETIGQVKELIINSGISNLNLRYSLLDSSVNNDSLQIIKCLAQDPPSTNIQFSTYNYLNTKLYVPNSYIDKYKNDSVWGNFFNIETLEDNFSFNPWELWCQDTLAVNDDENDNDWGTPQIIENTAGTLYTIELTNPKYLKIKGQLNGSDILYLRSLMGSDSQADWRNSTSTGTSNGSLVILDLSEAQIVSGGSEYYTYKTDPGNDIDEVRQGYKLNKLYTKNKVISNYLFNTCSTLKELWLPTGHSIEPDAFDNALNIQNMIVNDATPPTIEGSGWKLTKTCTVFVPDDSIDLYKESDNWNFISTIEPFSKYCIVSESEENKNNQIGIDFNNIDKIFEIREGEKIKLKDIYEFNPLYTTTKVNNPYCVLTNGRGEFFAAYEGICYAIVTYNNENPKTIKFIVTPNRGVESISLNIEAAELKIDETLQLEAVVKPEDTTDPVTWSSSNGNVATVTDKGFVKAISEGSATIMATCGNVTAECRITILKDSGVESIIANPNSKISIYSIDGILIKKDCCVEDLKTLNKGIYIIVSGKERYKIAI